LPPLKVPIEKRNSCAGAIDLHSCFCSVCFRSN